MENNSSLQADATEPQGGNSLISYCCQGCQNGPRSPQFLSPIFEKVFSNATRNTTNSLQARVFRTTDNEMKIRTLEMILCEGHFTPSKKCTRCSVQNDFYGFLKDLHRQQKHFTKNVRDSLGVKCPSSLHAEMCLSV